MPEMINKAVERMAKGNYNYDPAKIVEFGIDRMRFELGDTMTDGGAQTSALTDEEIDAALTAHPKSWKRAKLFLLESLCRRFSYEVDTKTGPVTLGLNDRAKRWREDYEKLEKEVKLESYAVPEFDGSGSGEPYFYTGMQENTRAKDGYEKR